MTTAPPDAYRAALAAGCNTRAGSRLLAERSNPDAPFHPIVVARAEASRRELSRDVGRWLVARIGTKA